MVPLGEVAEIRATGSQHHIAQQPVRWSLTAQLDGSGIWPPFKRRETVVEEKFILPPGYTLDFGELNL